MVSSCCTRKCQFSRRNMPRRVSRCWAKCRNLGYIPCSDRMDCLKCFRWRGGTTQKSGPFVTITHRSSPNTPIQVKLVEVGKSTNADPEILPGDSVFVSKAGIVYVVGDVKNPTGVVIENDSDMTVLKAIAIAGGVNPTAAVNSAKLIRRTSNGPEESSIPLKKILAAKVTDRNYSLKTSFLFPTAL